MKISAMFPSAYLVQDDFPAPRTFIMDKVVLTEIRRPNGKQQKPVLHFQNSKPMILNKTNAKIIARLYGTDSTAWAGQPIEVYHEPSVTMAGEEVGGIRVRQPAKPTRDQLRAKALKDFVGARTFAELNAAAERAKVAGLSSNDEPLAAAYRTRKAALQTHTIPAAANTTAALATVS